MYFIIFRHMQRKKSYAANKNRLPHFPKTPDRLVEDLEKRKVCLINSIFYIAHKCEWYVE